MTCQNLFSGKNKKTIIILSSTEFAQSEVKVKPSRIAGSTNNQTIM